MAVLSVVLIVDIVRTPSTEPVAASTGLDTTSASTTRTVNSSNSTGASVSSGPAAGFEPTAADTSAASATDPAATAPATAHAVGELPGGEAFTPGGAQTFRVVPGLGAQVGGSANVATYTVEIEDGITPAGGDEAFAAFVDQTLADPRSWTSVKDVSLRRIDATSGEQPNFRITLTSQLTVRDICGFDVQIESSCYSGTFGRVVLNDARWVRGAYSYGTDLTAYRTYAVNHEVGHALGSGHEPCSADGGLAPVMMQQTWSTSNNELNSINGSVAADGNTCVPNPWPNPQAPVAAATDAAANPSVEPSG